MRERLKSPIITLGIKLNIGIRNKVKNRIAQWFEPKEVISVEKKLFNNDNDNDNDTLYLIVTHKNKYKPHKMYLKELLEKKCILHKLDKESYAYIIMLSAVLELFSNDDYTLETCNILAKTVTVRNVKTLKTEEWDYDVFKIKYPRLDKNSIFQITSFFNNQPNKISNEKTSEQRHLKLIK